jgi:hypothetical protein
MAAPVDREKFEILFGAGFFGAHVVSLLPLSRWFGWCPDGRFLEVLASRGNINLNGL